MRMNFVTDVGLGRNALTTVADALERLSQDPAAFRQTDHAILRVVDLTLPSGRTVPSPALIFTPPHNDLAFAAMLAPATHCWATDSASGKREKYDMHVLDGAVVHYNGLSCCRFHGHRV